jgi:hypothetical protein
VLNPDFTNDRWDNALAMDRRLSRFGCHWRVDVARPAFDDAHLRNSEQEAPRGRADVLRCVRRCHADDRWVADCRLPTIGSILSL